jgi:methionyl-tRNA formyltransferase
MRVIFAGTPNFAVASLNALLAAGHELVLVLTQPDRAAGRGMAAAKSPVKLAAEQHALAVLQPPRLDDATLQAALRAAHAQVIVVAAYGLVLPPPVLDIAPLGALNVHASLLPRWRGAAPIQRALLAGDAETGVCLMQMDAGLDTGAVLACERTAITPEDTGGILRDRLAALGADMLVAALPSLASGALVATPQPPLGVTYAPKIAKRETRIDWRRPAVELERQIRAFDPVPGAVTDWRGVEIKIWRATVAPASGQPGTVLEVGRDGIVVACGEGALRATRLQRAGGKQLAAADFLRGFEIASGGRFAID